MSLSAAVGETANQSLPRHVAIIMDGNGRWAQSRGKIRVHGHKAGVKSVRDAVSFAARAGMQALTLFAFSSENWRRPEGEVNALMELFMLVLGREVETLHQNGIRLRVIGDTRRFSDRLRDKIARAEALTANNRGLTLNIAANYGGQWDIVQAARRMAEEVAAGHLACDQITEATFADFVCMADLPPVDLLIRTGGDHRISNFVLWQMAYAELYFTPVLWPDFDEQQFSEAIASFVSRERRFGCTGEQIRALIADRQTG
ncbi:polyprenyl diphosphate synthase [Aeromonas schubertii]|uniref:Ditrans,polycis-undecaprenyl-diphosphate synthase ((2E,6E)-farnesyl-diphosphate specific) n=1 Tax=Aeromonas schubertii TaxID=652 RepID=A0A0S2SFY9_9GAMM|nr:polyprenyl diphosphate synthase [Aeromonas schubertii]ALP40647.1 UDP diphosphate synthase [Aeromonas schubertii]KUE80741.1 UDP pyrophosphate synthase [Aeromonas schubertii]MBZ6067171.1 di-trans,poly-cis-decaprenylcistransferase [Aeromonas schubertii]MBZ6074221.1 di-trans,poly-cis-decaprenylcistransferase [Aeromonas schubertii]QCG48860.1 di-trans,poly-cis-decaprenylcistransferase [Aeromonas schubertii]